MKDQIKLNDITSDKLRDMLVQFIKEEVDSLKEAPVQTQTGPIPQGVGFNGGKVQAANDQKVLQKAKVTLFFDQLKKNPTLMGYLHFSSPVEQVQAIVAFADLVGVPKSQLVALLTGIRKVTEKP